VVDPDGQGLDAAFNAGRDESAEAEARCLLDWAAGLDASRLRCRLSDRDNLSEDNRTLPFKLRRYSPLLFAIVSWIVIADNGTR
jgi:hypothetical protein